MFRLYLEWARLVSPKRGLMDFEFTTEPVFVAPPSTSNTEGKTGAGGRHPNALDKLRVARPAALKRDQAVVVEEEKAEETVQEEVHVTGGEEEIAEVIMGEEEF